MGHVRNVRWKLALLILLVPGRLDASEGLGRISKYLGWAREGTYIVAVEPSTSSNEGLLTFRDVDERAGFCRPDSPFFCFRSRSVAFAFPRSETVPERWNHAGISCERFGEQTRLSLLGRELSDVFAVRCEAPDIPTSSFVYSREAGIVGFEVSNSEWKGTYWLEGRHGLGAKQ